ncbi:hypothetical protein ASE72_09220 [Sphingomonas sp. Leaf20]|nr:hypothetical protein ASE72_09220 [Sphingomonas sp. Leaf20]
MEPHLRALLTLRRDQLISDGDEDLGDLVHFIVVRNGDTLAAVETEAGVALSINPIDGRRLGDPDFEPLFEYVKRQNGFLEAVMILNDDGFAVVLLVPDTITVDPNITLLLRRCAAV